MIVRVDAATPGGIEAFRVLGDVRPFALADAMADPSILADAQVLVARSAQPIDRRLLEALPNLLAIATPVVGMDHVDADAVDDYGRARGRLVPVFHAPGSTAGAVGDFALAAILAWTASVGQAPGNVAVGIVGLGRCGTALARRLDRFGARWVAFDPPREARDPGFRSASLDEALACDAVSIHVPLTTWADSPWPTRGMVDSSWLSRFESRRPRLLVNMSRGPVVAGEALKAALAAGDGLDAALDVWPGEPTPDPSLVAACRWATPHAAGSVREGRRRAALMVIRALRRFLASGEIVPEAVPDDVPSEGLQVAPGPLGAWDASAIREAIGLEALSRSFREAYADASPDRRAATFETVRREAMRLEVQW